MGCETDAPGNPVKFSSAQAISYGLLVACLVLLAQTAFSLTRARAESLSALEASQVELPPITQIVLSLTPPVLFVLAGVVGTVLTVKEILVRNTAIKLLVNLIAALGLMLLFALALQTVHLPLAESATRLS